MRYYLLILIPLMAFSEYYDLCNGKEYTVSSNVLLSSDMKDHNVTETGIPFAPWIRCTDKDMNITTSVPTTPETLNINGKVYKLQNKPTASNCIPFGNNHIMSKDIYWRKCRRPNSNDWQVT